MKQILGAMLLLVVACQEIIAQAGQTTSITLKVSAFNEAFKEFSKGDTLCLELYQDLLKGRPIVKRTIDGKWNAQKDEYYFDIKELSGAWYFNIGNKSKLTIWGTLRPMLWNWNIEPGDKVMVSLKTAPGIIEGYVRGGYFMPYTQTNILGNYHPEFTGKGSLKYRLKYQIDSSALMMPGIDFKLLDSTLGLNRNYFTHRGIRLGVQTLDKYRKALGENTYNLLKMDMVAGMSENWVDQYHLSSYFDQEIKGTDPDRFYREHTALFENFTRGISSFGIQHSLWYSTYSSRLYRIFKQSAVALKDKDFPFTDNYQVLETIVEKYRGPVKDKILLDYVVSDVRDIKSDMSFLLNVMAAFNTDVYKQLLLDYLSHNIPGKPAYNFSLPDTSGKMVSLSDFRGKVVLIDFWFVGCGGCQLYYQTVLDPVEKHYKDSSNVVFITVSIDYSRDKWIKGIKSGSYTSERAVNLYTDSLGATHVMIKNYGITGYPFPILIDKEGKIYTTNLSELRTAGPKALINTIERALKEK